MNRNWERKFSYIILLWNNVRAASAFTHATPKEGKQGSKQAIKQINIYLSIYHVDKFQSIARHEDEVTSERQADNVIGVKSLTVAYNQ